MQRFQPTTVLPRLRALTFPSSLAVLAMLLLTALGVSAFAQTPAEAPAAAPSGAASGGEPLQVVAFGDSLVAGYGVGPGDSFPEQLQKALDEEGYDATVTNAGESGGTTTGGLARVEWSVPESADLVIVELGANDALRGISPQITRQNLDKIIAKLKARGQQVILAGMIAPPNMGAAYSDAFNPIYGSLSKKYDVPLYPFFLEGVAAEPALNQDDAMHPNADGVAVIVKNMLPTITRTLDRIGAAKASG